jgi:hypothetical protein
LERALGRIVDWTKAYQNGQDVMGVCLKQIAEYSSAIVEG